MDIIGNITASDVFSAILYSAIFCYLAWLVACVFSAERESKRSRKEAASEDKRKISSLNYELDQARKDKLALEREMKELGEKNKGFRRDLDSAEHRVKLLEHEISSYNDETPAREARLEELEDLIESKERKLIRLENKTWAYLQHIQSRPEYTLNGVDSMDTVRLNKGLSVDHRSIRDVNVSARIKSTSSQEFYNTTLRSCTCEDWRRNHLPCKHMYALAAYSGVLSCKDNDELAEQISKLADLGDKLKRERAGIDRIIKSKSQNFPALAKMFEKYYSELDEYRRQALLIKKQPALKASETVRQISREKRALGEKCRSLDYQLTYLKTLFPWLEDFVDTPPFDSAAEDPTSEEGSALSQSDDYISVRKWLSVDEYKRLPPVEKYQLALDRYISRKDKTKWDVGIEYEQYVGYLCETHGCAVEYSGAINGLDDMGRDLVAKINGSVYIIQCKRWHDSKSIHEKHIFQLFGSLTLYKHEHPSTDCYGVFITTTELSQRAADIAKSLNIVVYQNFAFDEGYPRIKCNISKSGEKIYHLPFDQQYNSVRIECGRGECYSHTTSDAEALGFRKALRHNMNSPGA